MRGGGVGSAGARRSVRVHLVPRQLGVSYGSITEMIDVGKAVCHDLRSGDAPPVVMGRLANVGFATAEASLVIVSAVSHMCVDAKDSVNSWAFQSGYTGQAL